MKQEQGQRTSPKQISCDPAENELTQARVAIGSRYDQIGLIPSCESFNGSRDAMVARKQMMGFSIETVPAKLLDYTFGRVDRLFGSVSILDA